MRPALPHHQALYRGATTRTVASSSTIDRQQILIGTDLSIGLSVLVVAQTRAAVRDCLAQNRDDTNVQTCHLARRQRRGTSQGMDPRAPQRLVGVNVAQPREKALVEQQWLDAPCATGKQFS
jgi:hypothetical protein